MTTSERREIVYTINRKIKQLLQAIDKADADMLVAAAMDIVILARRLADDA